MNLYEVYHEILNFPNLPHKHEISYDIVTQSNIEQRAIVFTLSTSRISACCLCESYDASTLPKETRQIVTQRHKFISNPSVKSKLILEWVGCIRAQCPRNVPRLRLDGPWMAPVMIAPSLKAMYSVERICYEMIQLRWLHILDKALDYILTPDLVKLICDYDPFHFGIYVP